MSNWTIITADDLKAAGFGLIVDKAQTTAVGSVDPVAYVIADAVARVRRSLGRRVLDLDPTKVPNSLKGLTVRLAIYALMQRIRLTLTEDQRKSRDYDNSDLLRLADDTKITVETPDNPAGSAEMQQTVTSETIQAGNCGNSREDLYRL
jgi:hypothetical protein